MSKRQMQMLGNPVSLGREASMLYEMGLEDYEIQYLLHMKMKQRNSLRWA